jgi:hypothetical protein
LNKVRQALSAYLAKYLHKALPGIRKLPMLFVALALLSCERSNPASLWLSYSQMETNLVLVDHEPPPF